VIELLLVPPASPIQVVEVLFSARGIYPDRLQMAVRMGADPNVGPCGRDTKVLDALKRFEVINPGSMRVDVAETLASSDALQPRSSAINPSQSRHFLDLFDRIGDCGLIPTSRASESRLAPSPTG
jgi:hypothetical protein